MLTLNIWFGLDVTHNIYASLTSDEMSLASKNKSYYIVFDKLYDNLYSGERNNNSFVKNIKKNNNNERRLPQKKTINYNFLRSKII